MRSYFLWLPNVLTLSRIVLAVVMFLTALQLKWEWAFWVLLVALLTDFLDGLAAKNLNAYSSFGEEVDGLADSALGILGLLSLGATGQLPWGLLGFMFLAGAVVGSDRVFRNQPKFRYRTIIAVVGLFLSWILVVLSYARLAFGWSWWYPVVLGVILLISAALKKHRLAAWISEARGV